MNDNAPDRERLIAHVLSRTVVIEEHLTKGLQRFLQEAGATPDFQETMLEFVKPVSAVLAEMEREVIDFARNQPVREPVKSRDFDRER